MDLRAFITMWAKRGLPAAACFFMGTAILLRAIVVPQMLLGFLFYLIAAIVVAGPIAQWLAEPIGSLFWPRRYFDKPQPIYGIPQSLRVKGHPEEAMEAYERLANEFPGEVRPYTDRIEIAIVDLRDPDRAKAIFQQGIQRLTNPDDKDVLATVYAETLTRLNIRAPHTPVPFPAKPRPPPG